MKPDLTYQTYRTVSARRGRAIREFLVLESSERLATACVKRRFKNPNKREFYTQVSNRPIFFYPHLGLQQGEVIEI